MKVDLGQPTYKLFVEQDVSWVGSDLPLAECL